MFKLALSAGHGKYTAGKRCLKTLDPNETREWVLNSRICEKIEEKLSRFDDISVLRLDDRTGKQDTPLASRTSAANSANADFYLSIHHNAGINGGKGGGIVAYVYPSVDADTLDWQKKLYTAACEKTGLSGNRATPLAKKNLYELRKSKMPAVLLECGFMDSATDIKYILSDSFAEGIAEACVSVIVNKAGLSSEKQKAPAAPQKNCFARYTGESYSIVMALKSLGETFSYAYRREIAAANNIKNYSGTAEQNLYMLSLLKKGVLLKP